VFDQNDVFFIADCHLDGSRPKVTALFVDFINAINGAGELWILGDLVEYWIGDDAGNPKLTDAFTALTHLSDSGTTVYVTHGNRDFLLGEAFGNAIGASVTSDDQSLVELGGKPLLLMHGDTLCTDDKAYQQLRSMLRSPQWQNDFLSKTIDERIAMAQALRDQSQEATSEKTSAIMDVNDEAVAEAFRHEGVQTLIHGHTHRPNTHAHSVDGTACTRIVLGDWHEDHAMVVHGRRDNDRPELRRFPFSA